jgi:hypothetical protein
MFASKHLNGYDRSANTGSKSLGSRWEGHFFANSHDYSTEDSRRSHCLGDGGWTISLVSLQKDSTVENYQ